MSPAAEQEEVCTVATNSTTNEVDVEVEEKVDKNDQALQSYVGRLLDLAKRRKDIIGHRNQPCPCGSGRKFKKCCRK